MKKMIVLGWEEEKKRRKRKKRKKKKKKKREILILKSESKPDEREKGERKIDDKNMVQIHDEQRSIQMTILHIYIYTKTLLRQALRLQIMEARTISVGLNQTHNK